jgi:hypothetical protein
MRASLFLQIALALAVVMAAPGAAQVAVPSTVRVTYSVDRTGPTYAELSGRVFNDGPVDVVDVYVNAAAIDASGKVVAQGIPFVGSVAARSSTSFKARVPVAAGAAGYRVGINSFRFGMGRSESP